MHDSPTPPAQHQDRMPGLESEMTPAPDWKPRWPGVGKLEGKVALVTGGDSGIGRAVAALFAREGAGIAIAYLDETGDARDTKEIVEAEGRRCLAMPGDLADKAHAAKVVRKTVDAFGRLDVVVNNAAVQYADYDLRDISEEQLRRTLDSNIAAYFFVTQAALDHLQDGAAIVNTASVNAFKGNASLVDYSTTRGAITAFTRSIASQLVGRGIRANAVAPGPVWTPFIPGTFEAEKVEGFGSQAPMGRPGQPWEIATSFLFLASNDSAYFTGQTLHPNGGMIVGS